jgi:hypothetical protein
MTGLALWSDNPCIARYSKAIALEFKSFRYDEIASGSPDSGFRYDWTKVRRFLNEASKRGHHGIVRFRDTDPEFSDPRVYPEPFFNQPGVPASVRGSVRTALYKEGIPGTAPATVCFPDWSNRKLVDFIIDFYDHLASEFDGKGSPLACVQAGFGLWGEYHLDFDKLSGFSDTAITSIETALGTIFPSKADQLRILTVIDTVLRETPWELSIGAADGEYSPLASLSVDRKLSFGLFDDSFLSADADGYNARNWSLFATYPKTFNGGEISYYEVRDQKEALSPDGPHGVSLAKAARSRCLSYLVANDQPLYRSPGELAQAGKAMGYHFIVRDAYSRGNETVVTIENVGSAAAFFDIYPAMGPVRAAASLRGVLPGAANACTVTIPATGPGSDFSLQSDRLLPGQTIPFDGND